MTAEMFRGVVLPRLLARRVLHRGLRLWLRSRSRRWVFAADADTVIIAPHPDDETFGCGGLIATKRRRGERVRLLFLTDGAASHPGHPTLSPDRLRSMRRTEAQQAADALGVAADQRVFLDLPDGSLARLAGVETDRVAQRIAAEFPPGRPLEIFLPSRDDGSSEHEAAFSLVSRATALSGVPCRCLEYPIWSWWSPVLLWRAARRRRTIWRVDFRPAAAAKKHALDLYRSQLAGIPPWTESVLPADFPSFFRGSSEYFFENPRRPSPAAAAVAGHPEKSLSA